jgi:hypothetical protein
MRTQVDDLFAYFKFLRYKPYNDPAGFKELIKDKITNSPENGYKILQVVLQVGNVGRALAACLTRRNRFANRSSKRLVMQIIGHPPGANNL